MSTATSLPATSPPDSTSQVEKRDRPVLRLGAGFLSVNKWRNSRDGRTWFSYTIEKSTPNGQDGQFDRQRILLNASDVLVLRPLIDAMVPQAITETVDERSV